VDEYLTKRTYPVRLLGRSLTIQTTASRDEVDTVAKLVAKRMEEIRVASRSTDAAEVAMLTALNLAADLLRVQATLEDERGLVKKWATEVCSRMDVRSALARHDAGEVPEQR